MGEDFHFARINRAICTSPSLSFLYFLQGLGPISYFILITICALDSSYGSFPFFSCPEDQKAFYISSDILQDSKKKNSNILCVY